MNGSKLFEELFTMNSKRIHSEEAILKILNKINWLGYKKWGFTIYKKKSDSVEFMFSGHAKFDIDISEITEITNIIKDDMPKLSEGSNNIFFRYLRMLSNDDILKNDLKEKGIYFYTDSFSAYITITKEALSKL